MNKEKTLITKIASLETQVDFLETELSYLNTLLTRCGFPMGIETLKATVEEILGENPNLLDDEERHIF